ncbi:efflux RND transporter permease subunit [uncultured Neptuniibacter sp.]|uniref:efflux RND transporter permease subunit n=1 Tax=uncultured Neptuniibacter sp. TaxID=502143 RepID=UPI002626B0CA|nr:efflux RND transporter permease subunit [uncultured Neptuniibacter sp.]
MSRNIASWLIRFRIQVVSVIMLITLALSYSAFTIEVKTVFQDLLPSDHEYVKTHNQFKDTFGGSNLVTIMVESEEGDIFQPNVLGAVDQITKELQKVSAVNPFQIVSLASKKLKEVKASTSGIETKPLMWPDLPETQADLDELREKVLRNSLVYGPYVSSDLTSTLITVDFIDRLLDYETAFSEISTLVNSIDVPGVKVRVVGDPMLYGWVNYYLPETLNLVLMAGLILLLMLFVINRTWRGTILPIISGFVSAIWALGISNLIGIHFDPLVIVIAMLITARAVSHSVQIITRFNEEVEKIESGKESVGFAAHSTLSELIRPGILGIATDACCVAVVALSPIPLLQKLALLAVVWVSTVAISSIVLTPVLLSWVKHPRGYAHPINVSWLIHRLLDLCHFVSVSRVRYFMAGWTLFVFLVCGYFALGLKVGDANPGSPILWPESQYNQDSAAINSKFQGADRMFIVVGDDKPDLAKTPEILQSLQQFQRFMEVQPEVGGTLSISDVLPSVNRTLREGNPRYEELGSSQDINGELLYMFEAGAEPGDMDRYVDIDRGNASVTLFFRDRQGETIRTAVARIKEFIAENPLEVGEYQLAGGLIGVIAAVNEVILSGQLQSIALALLILVVLCTVVYRSSMAGMFFMVPVVLSNTVTFSFMSYMGIGMNINTVPVAALGIGLGVDYALYIVDRIKQELQSGLDERGAIEKALHSAGKGVVITAFVLIVSVLLVYQSSLKFQAEMGMLVALWLTVSAFTALFVMPALVYIFKPAFIYGDAKTSVPVSQKTAEVING